MEAGISVVHSDLCFFCEKRKLSSKMAVYSVIS